MRLINANQRKRSEDGHEKISLEVEVEEIMIFYFKILITILFTSYYYQRSSRVTLIVRPYGESCYSLLVDTFFHLHFPKKLIRFVRIASLVR